MKKSLFISSLCFCVVFFAFSIQGADHAVSTAKQVWKAAEKKIKDANEQMDELEKKVRVLTN